MEEKSLEPHNGAEPEPQQREEKEKKEEEIERQEQQEDEKQNVAQENKEKEGTENSETQKAEVLFSSEKVEVQLIPVASDGSLEDVHKLDEYVSLFQSLQFQIFSWCVYQSL